LNNDEAANQVIKITLDADGITTMEASEGADLFSMIAMVNTVHQMLMSQYFAVAAAKVQARENEKSKFTPKLLIPKQGVI
jgi:hypothetical protein